MWTRIFATINQHVRLEDEDGLTWADASSERRSPDGGPSVGLNSRAIFRLAHISPRMGSYSFGKGGSEGN